MNFVAALLYPITLLLSAGGSEVGDSRDDEEKAAPVPAPGHVWVEVPASGLLADPPAGATVILPFQPEPGWQVRIEQHVTQKRHQPSPRDRGGGPGVLPKPSKSRPGRTGCVG